MIHSETPHKIGMVFGVFDGLHAGHRYFLTEASKHCLTLIVVVTLSEIVEVLKHRAPRHTYTERVAAIRSINNSKLQVVSGDTELGSWAVVKKYSPEIVLLGYDQQAIADELRTMNTLHTFLDAHYPEKHKSSTIREKKIS